MSTPDCFVCSRSAYDRHVSPLLRLEFFKQTNQWLVDSFWDVPLGFFDFLMSFQEFGGCGLFASWVQTANSDKTTKGRPLVGCADEKKKIRDGPDRVHRQKAALWSAKKRTAVDFFLQK
nr:hypothetical protein [Pandoravirus massiliensis]